MKVKGLFTSLSVKLQHKSSNRDEIETRSADLGKQPHGNIIATLLQFNGTVFHL